MTIATALASCLLTSANTLAAMLCDQQIANPIQLILHVWCFSFQTSPLPLAHPPPPHTHTRVIVYNVMKQQKCTIDRSLKKVATGIAAAASQQCSQAKLQQLTTMTGTAGEATSQQRPVQHMHQHQRGVYLENHPQ